MRLGSLVRGALAVALGLAFLGMASLAPISGAPVAPAAGTHPAAAAPTAFINISATTVFTFLPAQVTVPIGSDVHLKVTQLADFLHTFVLSSVANSTIPTTDTAAQLYAFFNAHPPLVNLSLGTVAGVPTYWNFSAPAAGTYEYVCEVPGHFQSGMHGVLTVGPAASSSSSPSGLTTLDIALIALAVVVIIAVVLVVALRGRGRRPPATPAAPPPTEGSPTVPPSGPTPPTPPPSSP